jgi:hypothetical protein
MLLSAAFASTKGTESPFVSAALVWPGIAANSTAETFLVSGIKAVKFTRAICVVGVPGMFFSKTAASSALPAGSTAGVTGERFFSGRLVSGSFFTGSTSFFSTLTASSKPDGLTAACGEATGITLPAVGKTSDVILPVVAVWLVADETWFTASNFHGSDRPPAGPDNDRERAISGSDTKTGNDSAAIGGAFKFKEIFPSALAALFFAPPVAPSVLPAEILLGGLFPASEVVVKASVVEPACGLTGENFPNPGGFFPVRKVFLSDDLGVDGARPVE